MLRRRLSLESLSSLSSLSHLHFLSLFHLLKMISPQELPTTTPEEALERAESIA